MNPPNDSPEENTMADATKDPRPYGDTHEERARELRETGRSVRRTGKGALADLREALDPTVPESPGRAASPPQTRQPAEAVMAKNTTSDSANLAALNRAKELAGKWETEAARLDALAALKDDPADRAEVAQAAQAHLDCARELREALS